jgi:ABC-2 type transport system permease protein
VPGILVLTIGYGSAQAAVSVASDMTQGVINRFRTMAISRASVLTGHVLGSTLRAMVGSVVIVLVALLMGFEPGASLAGWLGAIGMTVLLVVAMTWLSVASGLMAKSPEGAAFGSFPLAFLPYLSSAFAPTGTMPAAVRAFADNQPMTPAVETIRGLLKGTPIGNHGLVALIWWVGLALVGYFWSKKLFARDPVR